MDDIAGGDEAGEREGGRGVEEVRSLVSPAFGEA